VDKKRRTRVCQPRVISVIIWQSENHGKKFIVHKAKYSSTLNSFRSADGAGKKRDDFL
jgi:hypothetical protein